MLIDNHGEVTDAIKIPDNMKIFEYFKVLVYRGHGKERECVGEEDFQEFPTDKQVMWSVFHNNGSYAEVTKILAPHVVPFSEDDFMDDVDSRMAMDEYEALHKLMES